MNRIISINTGVVIIIICIFCIIIIIIILNIINFIMIIIIININNIIIFIVIHHKLETVPSIYRTIPPFHDPFSDHSVRLLDHSWSHFGTISGVNMELKSVKKIIQNPIEFLVKQTKKGHLRSCSRLRYTIVVFPLN